jgi:SLT domain-containing protein
MGPSGGPPAGGPPPGNVQEWIKQAIEILRQNGVNVSEADAQRIWQIIQHESGGNPQAINNWDSNAAKGTPSKGLMQCIDPTFNSYKIPGHGDIWNPVDNICAGVNYAISRYGSLGNVPGIKATAGGGSYVGY